MAAHSCSWLTCWHSVLVQVFSQPEYLQALQVYWPAFCSVGPSCHQCCCCHYLCMSGCFYKRFSLILVAAKCWEFDSQTQEMPRQNLHPNPVTVSWHRCSTERLLKALDLRFWPYFVVSWISLKCCPLFSASHSWLGVFLISKATRVLILPDLQKKINSSLGLKLLHSWHDSEATAWVVLPMLNQNYWQRQHWKCLGPVSKQLWSNGKERVEQRN